MFIFIFLLHICLLLVLLIGLLWCAATSCH